MSTGNSKGRQTKATGRDRTRRYVSDAAAKSFEPFAAEVAYVNLNERLLGRVAKHLGKNPDVHLLDIAAGTGLITSILYDQLHPRGSKLQSTLLDLDLPALQQARKDVHADRADFLYASADHLPLEPHLYHAITFANSIHLLDNEQKARALAETYRVMKPGGVIAVNSTFYDGAYPEESKPFYSRWIRRAIVEINQRLPQRSKSGAAQAMEFLPKEQYLELISSAGFTVVETKERRVLLSQSAVRAISSYAEFAKGALHASEEDADEASRALQVTVQQTFRDLKMKYLPRNWLEIIAVKG